MNTEAQQELNNLLSEAKTLSLSSISQKQELLCSLCPFAFEMDLGFFILTSRLSEHTGNLLTSRHCAILVHADGENSFALKRAMLQCEIHRILPDSSAYGVGIAGLSKRHGPIVQSLLQLPDFLLFLLKPASGRLILGFGQAYSIEGHRLEVKPLSLQK